MTMQPVILDPGVQLEGPLRTLLADTVTVKFRAQSHHWNVLGPLFGQYHEVFGDAYALYEGFIDDVAENLRKLARFAPGRLEDYIAMRAIPDAGDPGNEPVALAADLLLHNTMLIECAMEAFDAATQVNEQGLINFLGGMIDSLKKLEWQLRVVSGAP